MKSESIIKFLKAFDLNTYEAKCYLALLRKERLSAVEVAKISGVPRARVYEILDNLNNRGFCNLIPGPVKKYKAVSPTVFHDRVGQKQEAAQREIDRKKETLELNIERKKQKISSAIDRKKYEFESKIEQEKQKFESELKRKTQEFHAEMERKNREFNSGLERKVKQFHSQIEKEAVKVDSVIRREKQKFDSQAEKEKLEIELLKKNTVEIVDTFIETFQKSRTNTAPLDYIEVLKDPSQIFNKFMQLESKAEKEVCAFIRSSYKSARPSTELVKKYDKAEIELRFKLLKKGVKYRVVYEAPSLDESVLKEHNLDKANIIKLGSRIDRMIEAGEEAKTMPVLPMVMSIWDSKALVVMLNDPITGDPSHTSLFIEHPIMAQNMKIIFESYWQQAEDRNVWKEREHKKLK